MKCRQCETDFELTRENIIRKIVTPKGTEIKLKERKHIEFTSPLFRKQTRKYDEIIHTLRAKQDLISMSFICPVCDFENGIKNPDEPFTGIDSSCVFYEEDDWELVYTAHNIKEEVCN